MAERQLSGPEIRGLIEEVAARLAPEGPQHTVIIVGGSLLAWRGLRYTTEDVDSVRRLDAELRAAVASVAPEHGRSPTWLNANAAWFIPATFDPDACEVLLDHPRLLVLGAPIRDVFVMKMYRSDPNDHDDMVVRWPLTGFAHAKRWSTRSSLPTPTPLRMSISTHPSSTSQRGPATTSRADDGVGWLVVTGTRPRVRRPSGLGSDEACPGTSAVLRSSPVRHRPGGAPTGCPGRCRARRAVVWWGPRAA